LNGFASAHAHEVPLGVKAHRFGMGSGHRIRFWNVDVHSLSRVAAGNVAEESRSRVPSRDARSNLARMGSPSNRDEPQDGAIRTDKAHRIRPSSEKDGQPLSPVCVCNGAIELDRTG